MHLLFRPQSFSFRAQGMATPTRQNVVITGASSGIGRAVALDLAAKGYNLALADLDAEGGKALCKEIDDKQLSVKVVYATIDLSLEENVGKLFNSFAKTYPTGLHGLVNCAATNSTTDAPSHLLPASNLQKMMTSNLNSTLSCCTQFIRMAVSENNINVPPPGGYSIVNFSATRNLPKDAFGSHYVRIVSPRVI